MKIDVRFAVLVLIFCSLIPCCAGVVFCPDDRFTMPISNTLPWGAVGYIDNGCTATLIDSQHIVAAAHCFANDVPGSWWLSWTGHKYPRFYPNFNSTRPNPPYVDIDRAVVGTRVQTGGEFQASDWGIGHLAKPVTDFPSMSISSPSNTPINNLMSSGYGRDPHFFTPQGGNVWFQSALVDPDCTVYHIDQDELFFDCGTVGGNSGSPIIRKQQRKLNNYFYQKFSTYNLIGVIHGGPYFQPEWPCEPVSDQRLSSGPSAKRFQYAPKYAENVAMARYIDGSPRTQIFVADSDSDLVVTRSRNSNIVTDGFSTFDTLGSVKAPRRIAAFLQTNNKPQIVVTSDNGDLYTRAVAKDSNSWKPWKTIDLPWRVNKVLDVDAAYDSEGTNQIFIVGDDGNLYTRGRVNKEPDSAWKQWEKLTKSGIYRTVTSVRRSDGTEQVFLVDSTGSLATLWQLEAKPTSLWSMAMKFEAPFKIKDRNRNPKYEKIIDIDAAWTEDESVQLFAVDNKGGLWIQTIMPGNPSNGWQPWDTHLYAPAFGSPQSPPEGIISLTASRWQEETNGDIVPVVFATDNRGNIYYTTHTRLGGWSDWKSFYQ